MTKNSANIFNYIFQNFLVVSFMGEENIFSENTDIL